MKIACIVGARPNFMKIAPILNAMKNEPTLQPVLIHTGQHYDKNLSGVFFDELGIPRPDLDLNIGSGSHAQQTAGVMLAIEEVLIQARDNGESFDRMIVVGDVNSTMAAAITAAKLHIPVAHVEAGLRSFDRKMPEEINRLLTDSICNLLLASEPIGVTHLKNEGHAHEKIHLVGNVMIDTLLKHVDHAQKKDTLKSLELDPKNYGIVTLHRPSNVDRADILKGLIKVLADISAELPLAFPIHPRTKNKLKEHGLYQQLKNNPNIKCLAPLGYLDFLCLTSQAKVIVTDSGGLQEESTALGVPCLTMRTNTERPITVDEGTSTLIGNSVEKLKTNLQLVQNGTYKKGKCPKLWDGKASERIIDILRNTIA